jgi:hypothetical protein
VRHLNDFLVLVMVGLLIMTVAAVLTVRWLLARKQKRKSRGNAHWIDIGARVEGEPRSPLGRDGEPR